MKGFGTVCMAGLVCAAGCVDQRKEVALYRDVLNQNVPPATAPADDDPIALIDAMRLANANNEQLGISGENYLQALINQKRAVAAFLPTISLAPVYLLRNSNAGNDGFSGNSQLDVPIVGGMNLFNGFRDVATLRGSEFTAEQQRLLMLDLRQSLLIDVARAYFQVLRAEQLTEVLVNSIQVQEERVADIRARQRVGFAKLLDVSQAEAQASATRVALVNARNDVRRGRELLTLLTGIEVGNRALRQTIQAPPATMPVESIEAVGLQRRQDLLASIQAVEAARQGVEAALGQYWPSVSVNVAYFLSRDTAPTDIEWTSLFTANLPIFSAGLIEADVRDAWSQLRQAKYNESFIRRQVVQDVRIAYDDFAASRARLAELETQLAAAQDALDEADAQFRAGRGTNLATIVAQDQLLSAQLQLTSERYDNRVFFLTLLRSAGAIDDVLQGIPATAPSTQAIMLPG